MSSSVSIYDLSVPILARQLEQLENVLKKGEEHFKSEGKDPETLVSAKLCEDMLVRSSLNSLHPILPSSLLQHKLTSFSPLSRA